MEEEEGRMEGSRNLVWPPVTKGLLSLAGPVYAVIVIMVSLVIFTVRSHLCVSALSSWPEPQSCTCCQLLHQEVTVSDHTVPRVSHSALQVTPTVTQSPQDTLPRSFPVGR